MSLKTRFSIVLLTFFCLVIQLYIQLNGIIHNDLLWSFEIGKRLYAGKIYGKDFFETNPPLLYYLHAFLFMLGKQFHIKTLFIFYGFISSCALTSLYLNYKILRHLFKPEKKPFVYLMVMSSLLITVVLNIDYGQKEMIMVLLSFPFFWLSILRTQYYTIPRPYTIIISLLAGIGFAFKPPYFYIPLMLTEWYLAYTTRNWRLLFRLELWLLFLIFIAYVCICCYFSPTYLNVVFPTILKSYTQQPYTSFLSLLFNYQIIYLMILSFFWCYVRRLDNATQEPFKTTIHFWYIVSVGFALSFLLQGKGWPYQMLPLLCSNFIMTVLLLFQAYRNIGADKIDRAMLSVFTFFIFTVFFGSHLAFSLDDKLYCLNKNNHCEFLKKIKTISQLSPNHSFYLFSTNMEASYLIYYGKLKLQSRFASLWTLPAINNPKNPNRHALRLQLQDYIVEDFKRFKPTMILVNQGKPPYISAPSFSYLTFMLSNPAFSQIWKNYQFKQHVNFGWHQYDIYFRKESRPT